MVTVVAVTVIGTASVLLIKGSRMLNTISVADLVGLGAEAVLFTESKVGTCRRCGQGIHKFYYYF